MNRKRFPVSLVILSVVLVGLVVFFVGYQSNLSVSQGISTQIKGDHQAHMLVIEYEDGTFDTFRDIPYHANRTLFELLNDLDRTNDSLDIVYKNFGGSLGMFVAEINGIGGKNTSAWWQYWINDHYAQTGISSYILNPGDRILFLYTSEQTNL